MQSVVAVPTSTEIFRPVAAGRRLPIAAGSSTEGTHVISARLFNGALIRERKRADRSNHPFALLVVEQADGFDGVVAWPSALAALADVKRDTDVLGWFAEGKAAAILVPEIDGVDGIANGALAVRVRQAIAERLDRTSADRFVVKLHVHASEQSSNGADRIDPLLASMRAIDPRVRFYEIAKRVMDIAGSAALLAALSPILLVVAALVKLTSKGPVFFRQARIGQGAQPFTMLKFRTMRTGVDSAIHQEFITQFIKAGQKPLTESKDSPFKLTKDPRITPIGRVLRRTSLDELPQLLNVFRGDMSLVGPRPPLPYEVAQYEPWHTRRVLEAKPGITGLWQVKGRSRTTFDDMVRMDLRYAKSCSVWNDVKILAATPAAVVSAKGAC
jgi:lipopolysaccharide/colanic/teichoic acid biosynthesis glycosyltransferase